MSRVAKTDPRLVAYADVDETNSVIGVALALGDRRREIAELLRSVQNDLFDVGADLCTPIAADPEFPPLRVTRRLHRAPGGGLRHLQRGAAEPDQLHPARRHRRRRAAAPGARRRPAGRAQRLGAAGRRRRADQRPRPRATSTGSRTCCSSSPARPTPAATCCGSPGAHSGAHAQRAPRRRARGPAAAQRTGGADSTQERKPVTVEGSMASSRGPAAGAAAQHDAVRRQREVVAVRARAATSTSQLRAARAAGWAGPTATGAVPEQRVAAVPGDADRPAGVSGRPQPHGDRAQAGEQEPAAEQEGHRHQDDDDRQQDQQDRGHGARGHRAFGGRRAQASWPAARSRDWRAAGGGEGLGVVALLLGAAQRLAGPLDVDLGGDLGGLGEDGDAPLGDREEAAVGGDDEVLLDSVRMVTTPPGASSPSSGACPGRTPSSPSVVRAMTMRASPDQILRSTATNSTCRVATTLLGSASGGRRAVRPGTVAPTLAASRRPARTASGARR